MSREDFTTQHRVIGQVAAWTGFAVMQAYSVASGLGFISLESPLDPIGAPFSAIMDLLLILTASLLVVTMVAVHSYAAPEHKIYSMTALAFMILLAGITSSVNFVVLIVSSQADFAGAPWLPLFLPYKWPAVAYVMEIFAWNWFYALSMLCAAPVFRGGRLERMVRIVMLVSGGLSLLGLIVFPFAVLPAIVISILGWGVAGSIVFLLLAIVFGRTRPGSGVRSA
ncbi:hypothetical protein ACFLXQ_05615 [Chloroflexota bacterium]